LARLLRKALRAEHAKEVDRVKTAISIGDSDAATHAATLESELEPYLRNAFEEAPIGIALVSVAPDSWGGCLRVNRALCELTGYPSERLEASAFSAILHADDVESDAAAVTRLVEEDGGFQLEQRLVHADGHVLFVMVHARLARNTSGEPPYCIRQIVNLKERTRARQWFGSGVDHDPLTLLLNRAGFVRELSRELARARRYGGGGAVLFVDLDDFERLNESLGYNAGDETLRSVGDLVQHQLRETDVFGRVGDDEFAALLPHASESEAVAVAERMAGAVGQAAGSALGGDRRLAASIGIATFYEPSADLSADHLLVDADLAMYAAKAGGKDRVAVGRAEIPTQMKPTIKTLELLRHAVADSRFVLHCQPIVDLRDDSVALWELLIRLSDQHGELIRPEQFLDAAVRSGSIVAIDRWGLHEAMRLIAAERDAGRDVCLAVNLSGNSVGDTSLAGFVERGLAAAAIDPSSLVLEISEAVAAAEIDRTHQLVQELADIGCCVTLDDYGAGAGSIYHVKYLPVDYVKIDSELTRNLPNSTTDQLVLESVVQMASEHGKRTIAEGVSDHEILEVLRTQGVDYAQGYELGLPLPVSEQLRIG
jgi:diguanylate cyclase (GGDEF)-like protein/PAS domain S-box-containing protein